MRSEVSNWTLGENSYVAENMWPTNSGNWSGKGLHSSIACFVSIPSTSCVRFVDSSTENRGMCTGRHCHYFVPFHCFEDSVIGRDFFPNIGGNVLAALLCTYSGQFLSTPYPPYTCHKYMYQQNLTGLLIKTMNFYLNRSWGQNAKIQ